MKKKEKAIITENKFIEYLDKHKIAYWYIQQDINTFSLALSQYNIQRPDFFILIPNIGFMLIDVEYKMSLRKYDKFCVCDLETKKYQNLQKYFNLPVWYAFSNDKINYSTWYFIPVSKILELRKKYLIKNKNYISLPINECIQLSTNEKLTKVVAS